MTSSHSWRITMENSRLMDVWCSWRKTVNVCGVRLGGLTTSDDADGLLLFATT